MNRDPVGAFVSVSVKEVFEAQTLLNLPRFIMIFLCGVVYPVSAMPAALQIAAQFLPLTYTINGLRNAFARNTSAISANFFVLTAFLLLFLFPAMRLLRKKFE
jgi:ABC-2 type transport system permease protein